MTTRKSLRILGCAAVALLLTTGLFGQKFAKRKGTNTPLGQISSAFQSLASRVNVSVVKIVAVGYRPVGKTSETGGVSARQQSGGSGVIIDPSGYIVTNAHVVLGAQRLQVILSYRLDQSLKRKSILKPSAKILDAQLVGLDIETDLALLKISATGLPALKFGDSDLLAPGQIVLAIGSPLGLQNTVTMGVVSSPARQLKPEDPMIYVQTDAPINPGSSGGALVNTDGELVGINTLMFSQSGGNEGIGFAAPSNIVLNVVKHIKEEGRMIRGEIGVLPQTVTLAMAAGLKLPQSFGVVLGDVFPGSPADQAGLKPGDVIAAMDGKVMENARQFMVNLYRPAIGDMVSLEVRRGRQTMKVPVKVAERLNDPGRFLSLITADANKVENLGIFCFDLNADVKQLLPQLRKGRGVLVSSRTADAPYLAQNFHPGDVIYMVNQEPVTNLEELKSVLATLKSGDPVAVQIQRGNRLRYLAFELP